MLAQVWMIVGLLGFEPVLDACVGCDRPVGAEEEVSFDYGAGGVRCAACARTSPGHRLPPHARAALREFVEGGQVPVGETAGHWRLLARYLDHHVLEGGSLRSLAFLVDTLTAPRESAPQASGGVEPGAGAGYDEK